MNDGQNEGVEVSVGGAGTAAKRYVDSDPTFGAPGGQGWALENGTCFRPALTVLVRRGPRFCTAFWALVSFVRPGKPAHTTGGAGRENGSLTRRDRLAVGPRKTLKEIPLYEFPGAALLGGRGGAQKRT